MEPGGRVAVKALTIRQPWAAAVFLGSDAKDVENRSSRTRHTGLLAIHAGLRWDPAGQAEVMRIAGRMYVTAPGGYVLGVVQVTGCHDAAPGCCTSPWAQLDAKFHITIAEPVKLLKPVPCPGALGWWNVPVDVEAEVRHQLAGLEVAS